MPLLGPGDRRSRGAAVPRHAARVACGPSAGHSTTLHPVQGVPCGQPSLPGCPRLPRLHTGSCPTHNPAPQPSPTCTSGLLLASTEAQRVLQALHQASSAGRGRAAGLRPALVLWPGGWCLRGCHASLTDWLKHWSTEMIEKQCGRRCMGELFRPPTHAASAGSMADAALASQLGLCGLG